MDTTLDTELADAESNLTDCAANEPMRYSLNLHLVSSLLFHNYSSRATPGQADT